MSTLLILVHVTVSIALIVIVLLQMGKGAEAGASFGAGAKQTMFGSTSGGSFMGKVTAAAATIFMLTSLTLAYFYSSPSSKTVMPSAVIIEVMAQTCCLLAQATQEFSPSSKVISVVGINAGKFHRLAKPGDVLIIEASLAKRRSNVWRFEVEVSAEDQLVAEAHLAISIMDRDSAI